MAQIAVKPIVLRDVLLSIATDDYEKHVSGVTITPTTGSVEFQGLEPTATFTFPTNTTWAVELEYAQDWDTTNSLSAYLFNNEGTEVTMTFEPVKGGAGFQATVIIAPGSIGGQVNSVATSTVTLGVVGRPTLIPAA